VRALVAIAGTFVTIGLVARLRAAFLPAFELFRSFPTEDGYLMMTVARNLAMGNGMTSAAGTMPTNGVQPLVAFLQAGCFWLVGGDRAAGTRLLIVVYTIVALATALLIYRLGLRLVGRRAALIGAAAWFVSPVVLFESMNMLETCLYAAAAVGVVWSLACGHRGVVLGSLLGLAFWIRNDAVLLVAAVLLAQLAARRIKDGAIVAATVAAASAPWLIYNLREFGHIMPTSGIVHLRTGLAVDELRTAAMGLFEYATLVASFEFHAVQQSGMFAQICAALVTMAALALPWILLGMQPEQRAVWLVPTFFGVALLIFYTLFFDAPHFLRRYLFPLSPFLALAWGAAVVRLVEHMRGSWLRFLTPLLAILLAGNFLVRSGVTIRGPWRTGALFHGAAWVEANLTDEDWVGAFQSGTLGFFHDRTINLDGKINPEALAALRERRHPDYVLDSRVDYLVDWASLLEGWARSDNRIRQQFETVELDRARNFAVMARR